MKTVMDNNTNHFELRFGYVVNIFYKIKNKPMPKQLDLLNEWFPSLIVQERNNEGVKEDQTYTDSKEDFSNYAKRESSYD